MRHETRIKIREQEMVREAMQTPTAVEADPMADIFDDDW